MSDFRLTVGLRRHPKTEKLIRRLGAEGFVALISLWEFCAASRPDGDLAGMDDEDIAVAATWSGDAGVLVEALAALRWLDGEPGAYRVHEWAVHNPHVAAKEARRAQASAAGKASAAKKKAENIGDASTTADARSTDSSESLNGNEKALNGSSETVQPLPTYLPTNHPTDQPALPGRWDPLTAPEALTVEHVEAWGHNPYGAIRPDKLVRLRPMLPITRQEFEDASRGATHWSGVIGNLTAIRNPGAAPKPVRSFGQARAGPPKRAPSREVFIEDQEPSGAEAK